MPFHDCFICLPISRLKESLAEALSSREGHVEAPCFDSNTPAEATIKILESLLHGDQVCYCIPLIHGI